MKGDVLNRPILCLPISLSIYVKIIRYLNEQRPCYRVLLYLMSYFSYLYTIEYLFLWLSLSFIVFWLVFNNHAVGCMQFDQIFLLNHICTTTWRVVLIFILFVFFSDSYWCLSLASLARWFFFLRTLIILLNCNY